MAQTQFGVVYGTASKIIRRILHWSDDSEVQRAQGALAVGESLIVLNIADYPVANIFTVQAAIGTPTASTARHAIVDATGMVVNACLMDPLLPIAFPGMTAIQSPTAQIGDTHKNGVFTTPPVIKAAV